MCGLTSPHWGLGCAILRVQVLFAGADIVVAWQLWRLGQLQGASESRCLWSMLLWLYNPFTVTISTRGSCDSLVTLLLLATMLLLLQGQRVLPALLYGLAVHFRIFPIVYAPAIVMYLAQRRLQQQQGAEKQLASRGSRKVCRVGLYSSPDGEGYHLWVVFMGARCCFGYSVRSKPSDSTV